MKILLLQSKPFLPVKDGGNEASRALVQELLEANFDISYLTFSSEKHPFQMELFQTEPWESMSCDHVRITLEPQAMSALMALISGKSYNLTRFTSPSWLHKIKELSKNNKFDIVLFDSLYAAQEFEKIKSILPSAKLVYRAHNIESKIWLELAKNEKSFFKKIYLSKIARQLEKREKKLVQSFDLILPISVDDELQFQKWNTKKTGLLPYFPASYKNNYNSDNQSFYFMGSMNWRPNIEAHDRLVNHLFPKIQKKLPNAKLIFAGGDQDQLIKSTNPFIDYLGFVENKMEFLGQQGVLLSPIESGSGVRVKLMEALAFGIPVVSSENGAEGIPCRSGEGIFIAKNDKEFVQMAVDLAMDRTLREQTSRKALNFILNWKAQFQLKAIFAKHDIR